MTLKIKIDLCLVVLPLLYSYQCAAQTQLWGMSNGGGQYGIGSIYKLDGSGNNFTIQQSFINDGGYPYSLTLANDGKLYGMTTKGGVNDRGVLFQHDPTTSFTTKILDFTGRNGRSPQGCSLIQANDGKLYGMTTYGGANDQGVLFQYDPVTSVYIKKVNFVGENGSIPFGSLVQASDGKLYGVTAYGGSKNYGVLFQYDPVTSTYSKKIDFSLTITGGLPHGSLVQANDGKLYGTIYFSSTVSTGGSIFQFDPVTSTYTKKFDFNRPVSGGGIVSLMKASDGKLYGMTSEGGANTDGVLFQYDPATSTYTKKMDLRFDSGSYPNGSLIQANDGKLYGMTERGGAKGRGTLFQYDLITSTYSKKVDFADAPNATWPIGPLVQANNGKLYGMTSEGGVNNQGVLFQYDPTNSSYSVRLEFPWASNGSYPTGQLTQATDKKLYGLTPSGGVNNNGVLFQYDIDSSRYTKKLDFDGVTNGSSPTGSLVQANDEKLYGITEKGGAKDLGVLFQYDPVTSVYTKKIDFIGEGNGSKPYGSLILASDGKLYGITSDGVLFQYDPITSVYTKKIDFIRLNVGIGSLVQATDGKLYGAAIGGVYGYGILFQYDLSTSVFTKKLDFKKDTNGWAPRALIQGRDGNLYGMTQAGGANDFGVLFQYDPATSIFTKKLDFIGDANGKYPSRLMQASDGKLYGTTLSGGGANYDQGILFQYDLVTSTYTKKLDLPRKNQIDQLPNTNLVEITPQLSLATSFAFSTTCAGSYLKVAYTLGGGGAFSGNEFTAQLSDARGSFASPITIGKSVALYSGTIDTFLPPNTSVGSGYRIRVLGSNPAIIGKDNGSDISINSSMPTPLIKVNSTNPQSPVLSTSGGNEYQWFKNGRPISGATRNSYTVDSEGSYEVQAFLDGKCESPLSDPYEFFVTGDVLVNNQLDGALAYPNPASNILTISLQRFINGEEIGIVLIDMLGRTIERTKGIGGTNIELNVHAYPSGSYIVMIERSKQRIATKFVKSN
jgi:uncharacterized repeat protein (TIGR03803 family)